MGGDHAPGEVVKAAVRAAREIPNVKLFLVGIEEAVRRELDVAGWDGAGSSPDERIQVVAAKHVIGMGESPVEALRRKRGSSIEEAVKLVRDGDAMAFLSAGNTGACVAASQLFLGLLPNVKKPGILVTLRIGRRPVCIIDVGANIASKPEHLIQYGVMGSLYAREIVEVENPRVGLLNIGEEDEKGNRLVKLTRGIFEEMNLNFVGNVEGAEVFRGTCDVVVCDGFTGNIVLKVSEGLAEQIVGLFKDVLERSARDAGVSGTAVDTAVDTAVGGGDDVRGILRRSLENLERTLDYSEYGGAPLLGVDGVVIISHGKSDAKAIFNAIRVAKRMIEVNINLRISEQVEN